jgi:hypothetical protein
MLLNPPVALPVMGKPLFKAPDGGSLKGLSPLTIQKNGGFIFQEIIEP